MRGVELQIPDWLRGTQSILEALNEGVVLVDDQLRVVYENDALLRLGGYERGELHGRTPDALFPPEDLPYLMEHYAIAQRDRSHRHQYYLPRKNGERVPVIFSGRIIAAPDGRHYSVLTLTDISDEKRVERELRQVNARLEQRQREIEAELSLAARVQQSLAPQSLEWSSLAIEAYYSPASTIGGDFGVLLPHGDELICSFVMCRVMVSVPPWLRTEFTPRRCAN
jgi:PAS domain S-box-containing protein